MSETVDTSNYVRESNGAKHAVEEPILCRRGAEAEIRVGVITFIFQVTEAVREQTEEYDILDKVKDKEVYRRGVDDCGDLAGDGKLSFY